MRSVWIPVLWTVWGCSGASESFTIQAPAELEIALNDYVSFLDRTDVALKIGKRCQRGQVKLVLNEDWGDCYQIMDEGRCVEIEGGFRGVQYGLSDVLEQAGMGFFHPHASVGPDTLTLPEDLTADRQCPDMARRGIHMHTLHPTEGYFDAWESGGDALHMRRIADWVIKNRGNHLQWVALDSMPTGWESDTRAINDALHARGITTGLGVQLFSEANLQEAFNLVADDNGDVSSQMDSEWRRVSGVGFDLFNLSFGEFFSSEPAQFIDSINLSNVLLQEQAPGTEMTTVLHVGDDLRVEYQGEEWIYYLLAQFADPEIKPWVHTVMYYNLYDDAGGAYHHEEFDQHRSLIEDYLSTGRDVGYFPESAYWCAFDSPIPQYLPVYIRSRWTDMVNLPGLQDHVLFSSGWEWGYWLNDVATLRMNWSVPNDYCDTIEQILEPLNEPDLAPAICALAEVQHAAMIDDRLAPWTASLDAAMQAGAGLDIVAQPLRTDFDSLTEKDADIATRLDALASDTEMIWFSLPQSDSPWVAEISEGMQIDVLRARFMARLIEASIAQDNELLAEAESLHLEARSVVDARHDALWDPDPERLLTEGDNHTLYDFGYLLRAEELCFWERELTQARNHITGSSDTVPGCLL